VHLVGFIIKKNTEKIGNKSYDGSDDRPLPDKCACGVAYSMMCVLVSCSLSLQRRYSPGVSCSKYVISFAIYTFNSKLSVFFFFCGTLLPECIPTIRNQVVLSRVMMDGRRVYVARSSKKLWIITMDSLVTWHVAPSCRK
jgi:hypothetical protein